MSGGRHCAMVQIGRFTLRLSPLKPRDLAPARRAWYRLAVTPLKTVASPEWLKAYDDALGFIFIAARQNHSSLSLAELHNEAEPEEIIEAFQALGAIMRERWGAVWEGPGNAEVR